MTTAFELHHNAIINDPHFCRYTSTHTTPIHQCCSFFHQIVTGQNFISHSSPFKKGRFSRCFITPHILPSKTLQWNLSLVIRTNIKLTIVYQFIAQTIRFLSSWDISILCIKKLIHKFQFPITGIV